MTILGENKTPIIEYLVSQGESDGKILELIEKEIIGKDLSSIYIHGMFEARFKTRLLNEIFIFLKKRKIKVKRIIDY